MTETFVTGRDCDAWCTHCKLDLAHTIVAMVNGVPVKVKCNTCDRFHKYRAPKSGPKAAKTTRTRSTASRTKKPTKAELSASEIRRQWEGLMAKHAGDEARPYRVTEAYDLNDTLQHSKFGLGFVLEAIGDKKIKVLFQDGERLLVTRHGQRRASAR